ncbi:MAG TPA: alkaline phosphatase family protein, partial [Solirubrobacteraceae bacterium]|nr:alkaline phosphatase family protein [Solirubrobacteraceae bacterium]
DHDVHDDWNISEAWTEEVRSRAWWEERIIGALVSYWIYQHLGNLSPAELEQDSLYQQVRAADDGESLLREFALRADREAGGSLWSFSRRIVNSRLLVLDSREGRVLGRGQRAMLDEEEWRWAEAQLSGDFDHFLVVSTLPVLLPPTLHYLEAWNEAVCDGAWGKLAARIGEKVRRAIDLEHWAAFQDSFHRLVRTLEELASGRRGRPPASIVLLGGDIHQAYVAEVAFRDAARAKSLVYQAVCSPFRHPLSKRERTAFRVARHSRTLRWLTQRMAHGAGVRDPTVRWRDLQEPTFDNQVAWVRLDGRQLSLTIEHVRPGDGQALEATFERRLA